MRNLSEPWSYGMSSALTSPFTYERSLPGGGFVRVKIRRTRSLRRGRMFEGTVTVERRAASRRTGHNPPIVAHSWGTNADDVIRRLFPIAQCNPMLGAALLEMHMA